MKLVVILILCIFIVLLAIILTRRNKENFTSGKVRFLTNTEACELIKDIDYFKNLTEMDIIARKFITNKNNSTENYCNNYFNFSKEEQEKIKKVIKRLPDNELFKNWSFAKMGTDVENGYPHTHKDTIFLSQYTIDETENRLLYVLAHEQMHVMQRKKPELFRLLYTKYYSFKVGKLELSEKYKKRMRSNPDTRYIPENDYIYVNDIDDFIYLCAFYTDEIPKNLGDVKYIGIKLDYDAKNKTYKSSDTVSDIIGLGGFNDFFRLTNNHYHPNEISAELIALYYADKPEDMCQGLIMTEMWLKENVV
jgi:hypothetical protein